MLSAEPFEPTNWASKYEKESGKRSSYVFVSRYGRVLHVTSFDDPRLQSLRIGIPIVGDDYANPPAAQALAARHIIDNVRGYIKTLRTRNEIQPPS